MNFSDIDMDSILNDSFENDTNDTNNTNNTDDESTAYLNQYNLIFFTDGSCLGNGKQDNRNKAGFGIYIVCSDENSEYYSHNDTKIIKKIDKDMILYNIYSYDIAYMGAVESAPTNIKCKSDSCTYFGIYGNDTPSVNTNISCKSHKTDNMILNKQFLQFQATNIRAEGAAILYALIYIKTLTIDRCNTKKAVIDNFKVDKINNIKNTIHPIDFRLKSNNKFMIVTDSEFWINVVTKWSNSWIKKFIILEKKNIDIIILINYYMNILYNNGIEIEFRHVKGHSDKDKNAELNFYQKGNVMSDRLANMSNKLKDLKLKVV